MSDFKKRYLSDCVAADLKDKMVFIGGPRQVGKTTFALSFISEADEKHPAYLNWDNVSIRFTLMKGELPPNQPLIILDEINKYARWRNLVKGFYDIQKSSISFIITGSARLDHYRKGGDSLQGRYYYYRLHPFTFSEIYPFSGQEAAEALMKFGGFPEPFLRGDERFWRRWQKQRLERVIYEDIQNLEQVKETSLLELLANKLPNRVSSPLSVGNLKDVLQVSHETAERWIRIFESMYYCFRIPPYGAKTIRAVKKEQKLYLYDWSLIEKPGPRFENMIACHLLKYCHFLEDTEGFKMELRFIRDTDKREVDFVILKNSKPQFAVECKSGENKINPGISYFRARTGINRFYQVHLGVKDYGNAETSVRVLPFDTFCRELGLP